MFGRFFWPVCLFPAEKMGGSKKFQQKIAFFGQNDQILGQNFFSEIVRSFIQWQKDGLRTPEKKILNDLR